MSLTLVVGKKIYLAEFLEDDVTDDYVLWLNDSKINQFLEARHQIHTRMSCQKHIREMSSDSTVAFYRIIEKSSGLHIGNIKLHGIDSVNRRAEIGVLIGDSSSFGKGFATEAIGLVSEMAKQDFNLLKVWAGADEQNLGSIKAFERNGFKKEGMLANHAERFDGTRATIVLLGKSL